MSTGSRYLKQFQYSLEQDSVSLFGSFKVASTLVSAYQGGGITSVTDFDAGTSPGKFNINLANGWSHFYGANFTVVKAGISTTCKVQLIEDPATIQTQIQGSAPVLTIQAVDFAGAAVDVQDDTTIFFEIKVRKSSVGYFDTYTTV